MMSPIVLISLGITATFMLAAYAFLTFREGGAQKDHARAIITGQKAGAEQKDKVNPQDKRRAEIAKKLKNQEDDAEKVDSKGKKKVTLREKILQAGIDISVKQYFIYSAIFCVAFSTAVFMLQVPLVLFICAIIISFFGVPRFAIRWMAKRRQKKFIQEFADALEAMVRLLKAGMPVSEAVAMVSREYSGPVGEEMAKIYDTQKIGVPLHEAALDAIKRMPLPEMKMFATGLSIQAQTGSSLSEVLTNLANVIRSRYKLARKVKALSSEAKAGAMIIGSMPILVAGGIYVFDPDHILTLTNDTFGKFLLAVAVIWMSIGIIIMKAMINFKV